MADQGKFALLEALALHLLEIEVREELLKEKRKNGVELVISCAEVDAYILRSIGKDNLEQYKIEASELIDDYAKAVIDQTLGDHIKPLLQKKTFLLVPVAIWHGVLGNLLTIIVIIFLYQIPVVNEYYLSKDLFRDLLSAVKYASAHAGGLTAWPEVPG
ncbi:hypothetical protein HJG45_28020 [Roseicella sp. DB1501]|nr:hypothetical protein [Roseicella sp. DB1501]